MTYTGNYIIVTQFTQLHIWSHNNPKPTFALKLPKMKIAEFANIVDPDEVAHYELPHLDLHYLPSSL